MAEVSGPVHPLVPVNMAVQHLNERGQPVTLCGRSFYSPLMKGTLVYDYRDGFFEGRGAGCQSCADAAEQKAGVR